MPSDSVATDPDPLGLRTAVDRLLVEDGPPAYTPDLVPTADHEIPLATYQAYRKEDTRVITCAVGPSPYPGEPYDTRDQARAGTERKYGTILEANYVPGRAFFRVFRTRPTVKHG